MTLLEFVLFVWGILYQFIGWLLYLGLKIVRPQEALVLTLFGNYKGTIREPGFYFVNPFCTTINPAANTKLAQSGDATNPLGDLKIKTNNSEMEVNARGKRISLKMMTLNNGRQKINDCLGNPVEIGIAVIWRVTDTAKAVFNVDNYKEYYLYNVMRLYVISFVSILMMYHKASIQPVMAMPMKDRFVDRLNWLHNVLKMKFKRKSVTLVWKLWKRVLRI